MKTKLSLGILLCICTLCSCNPENKDIIEPEQPPIEQPEQPNKPEEPEEPQKPEEPAPINGIIKINNEYMAVGSDNWNAIAFGNGKYVVGGNKYMTTTSTDGENWTSPISIGSSSSGDRIFSLCYGSGKFVAGAESGYYATSIDGQNWGSLKRFGTDIFNEIIFVDGKFIAIGGSNALISTDGGESWISNYIDSQTFNFIMYGNGKYAVVSSIGRQYTSLDLVTWTKGSNLSQRSWINGKFGNGKFVVISGNSNYILVSDDGVNWREKQVGTTTFKCITFGDGKFVATNSYKDVFTSTDGEIWTQLNDLPFEANDIIFVQ